MRRAIKWTGYALLAAPMLLPLVMLLMGSLMGEREVARSFGSVLMGKPGFARWPLIPESPTLRPYVELLMDSPEFFAMFWNSTQYAALGLVGQALVGAPAAWVFAKCRFPGRRALFLVYIALMLMPFQVTLVAQYLSLDFFRLIDTRWAIILPLAFSTFPVFIMTKFFEAVPDAILEAASIDGANFPGAFLRVGLPLGIPGFLSAMVLGFIEAWGMIEQPMTLLRNPQLWPLTLYLPQIDTSMMGRALVASVVALAPALLAFLFGQQYLESGISAIGVKE